MRSTVVGMQLETSGSRTGGDGGKGCRVLEEIFTLPGVQFQSPFFPANVLSPVFYHTENHSAPPDVTSYTNNTSSSTTSERTPGAGTAAQKQTPKYGNAELMETGDGEPRLDVAGFHLRSLRADFKPCVFLEKQQIVKRSES